MAWGGVKVIRRYWGSLGKVSVGLGRSRSEKRIMGKTGEGRKWLREV